MSIGGIYEILNTANGKRYIGSSANLKSRWMVHQRRLKRGNHVNPKLQNAWNKHGASAFKFLPILTCAESMLLFYEQQLLDKAKPEYNIAIVAGSPMRGRTASLEARTKMSVAQTGRRHSAETKAKIAASWKLRGPASDETRAKIGTASRGRVHSPEARAKISAAGMGKQPMLGHKHTTATKELLSAQLKGNAHALGFKHTAETKAIVSAGVRRANAYRRLMECQGALA